MGLERTVAMLNNAATVYDIDVFNDVKAFLMKLSGADFSNAENIRAMRIILDHIRTSVFILGDEKGVTPSNVGEGYVLRRLIRRAIRFARKLNVPSKSLVEIAEIYIGVYSDAYPELATNREKVIKELTLETERFQDSLDKGLKEFEKLLRYIQDNRLSGKAAFRLYDTFGFPIEVTQELASENNITIDMEGYARAAAEHQKVSGAGAEQKFKGGLQDAGEQTTRLHTATHLLLASLKRVLGDKSIQQKGSNITAERLRFDFNFLRPLTADELAAVEADVNRAIEAKADIGVEEMTVEAAKAADAEGVFGHKYGGSVKVFTMGCFSKEICGGPHASNTGELGKFKITKEQSSSAGVRRIKATLI
jgi:alanyl-tRNA synthetase